MYDTLFRDLLDEFAQELLQSHRSVGILFRPEWFSQAMWTCQQCQEGYSAHARITNKRSNRFMKILLNISIPHAPFNAAVRDGTAGAKLNRILEAIKPEAAYFTEQNSGRGAILIVDLPDPSKIPALAEPWFLTFQADVQFRVVMTPDDLRKAGLENLGKQWS